MLTQVYETIFTLPGFQNPKILDKEAYPSSIEYRFDYVVEGEVDILGQTVALQIALDCYFPFHKPLFYLRPFDALGLIPHVNNQGFICYTQDEGILLDTNRPATILQEAFQKAFQVLVDGVRQSNFADFMTEFETYFRDHQNRLVIESTMEISDEVREVKVAKFEHHKIRVSGDSVEKIRSFVSKYIGPSRSENPCFYKGIYIPLRRGTVIKPPGYENFWSTKEIKEIVFQNLTEDNAASLRGLIRQRLDGDLFLFISIPLDDIKIIFGIAFVDFEPIKGSKRAVCNPLHKIDAHYRIIPVYISRIDEDYTVPRGCGNQGLNNKRIAIIGCGSVGGYIAEQICKTGIKNLTLIDTDILTVDNIYRHNCGFDSLVNSQYKRSLSGGYFCNHKVVALKESIEAKIPDANIQISHKSIEEILTNNIVDFARYDLVIVAIGNPTIELYINKYFHEEINMPPVIFTWLEVYGIGGHAIVTNNNNRTGCLQCLYTTSNVDSLYNKASFAEQGRFFSKSLTGCGSLFMPYGTLDALQTAIVACRLAIGILSGKEEDNPILSWKGNPTDYLDNGYKLTDHHKMSEKQLYDIRYLYKVTDCAICQKG